MDRRMMEKSRCMMVKEKKTEWRKNRMAQKGKNGAKRRMAQKGEWRKKENGTKDKNKNDKKNENISAYFERLFFPNRNRACYVGAPRLFLSAERLY